MTGKNWSVSDSLHKIPYFFSRVITYIENVYFMKILLMPGLNLYKNPSMTASVKISQNVDILAKVYRVHWKIKHLMCTFTGQNESTEFLTGKNIVLYHWGWSQWQSKQVKNAPVCTFGSTVKTGSWLVLTTVATKIQLQQEGFIKHVCCSFTRRYYHFK